MNSGIISLGELYSMVKKSNALEAVGVKSKEGISYAKIITEAVKTIPEKSGFYLWGNFNKKKFWSNIYLGKAGLGSTTNLKSRIRKELDSERSCILKIKHKEDELENKNISIYGKTMWDKSYSRNFIRSLRKYGTTHIVWIVYEATDNKKIKEIENDLIESINPTANIQRTTPPHEIQTDTIKILNQFRRNIHEKRKSLDFRFDIPVH